jgi:hypothetical protein
VDKMKSLKCTSIDKLSRCDPVLFIIFYLLFIIFSVSWLTAFAQSNVQSQSFNINSSMITRTVVFPKSITSSYVVPSQSHKVSSYLTSSAGIPLIQIPSFTETNASLSISYETLSAISMPTVVEERVISSSKGTLFGNTTSLKK